MSVMLSADALKDLVHTARALPGEKAQAGRRLPRLVAPEEGSAPDLGALGRRTSAFFAALAERADPALIEALGRAERLWDQFDAISLFDRPMRAEWQALRRQWQAYARDEISHARAIESLAALDAAAGIVDIIERRLAALVRLRLRSDTPELLPSGRPFLDVAAALRTAAKAWSETSS